MSEKKIEEKLDIFVKGILKNVSENFRKGDDDKVTVAEILIRPMIAYAVRRLGNDANPMSVAGSIYELLHMEDNINYALAHRIVLPSADRRHKPKES